MQLLPNCWYNTILEIDKQKRQLLYFGKKNPEISLFHSLATKERVNRRENAILDSYSKNTDSYLLYPFIVRRTSQPPIDYETYDFRKRVHSLYINCIISSPE